jgi:indolepyruvate ferredoxin oxidoreductase
MGGEGLTWVGAAPFTTEKHVFQNLGDGTYNHSGSLAIRGAIAARANITYKLLFNDAVAMTGGQAAESGFTPAQITRQLAAEGVRKTVIVVDDVARYEAVKDLAPGVEVHPRGDLMKVQRELRETEGVTVLLYDQTCATEKRRRRKRGLMAKAPQRVFINPLVCEGCGDCSKKSNCVSVEPLNTEFGRKRKINQSTCNQDYSCVDGFCPSFITLEGAENATTTKMAALTADATPLPEFEPLEGVRRIVFTGIGGTGVTTVASILAMAAHVDGRAASVVDMTGLAQKGGSVFSHVKIGEREDTIVGGRVPAASTDVLIACDLLVAASPDGLALFSKKVTRAFGNADFSPTADFVTNRDVRFDTARMARRITAATKSYEACPSQALAEHKLGDGIYASMIMLGFTWQKGVIPVSSRAIYRAIKLNGVDYESNLQAFEVGRKAAMDPEFKGLPEDSVPTPDTMPLGDLIEKRTAELTAYQDAGYAARYRKRVDQVQAAETALGEGDALTRAVAINLYKLMAYKDEYEVARLYTDGRFAAELAGTFKGGKAKVWMSPPLISPKGPDGKPKKIALGGWMIDLVFPVLTRMKGLRGGPLDIFGMTEERRMERGLITSYEAQLDRVLGGLTSERLPLAARIAAVPQQIRGFGHIKEASVKVAKADEAALWAEWQ